MNKKNTTQLNFGNSNPETLLFLDLEFASLDTSTSPILEIAIVPVTIYLIPLADPIHYVFHHKDKDLEQTLSHWSKHVHEQNGLLEEVAESKYESYEEVETLIMEKLQNLIKMLHGSAYPHQPTHFLPVGSSLKKDLELLEKFMPKLLKMFSFRSIDLSGINLLVRNWRPDIHAVQPTHFCPRHRALVDAKSTLNLLQFYQQHLFGIVLAPISYLPAPPPPVETVTEGEEEPGAKQD